MEENQRVLKALERLGESLKELNDRPPPTTPTTATSAVLRLSHWRQLGEDVTTAYRFMSEGAELVKATSTKYTLVGKIDVEEGAKLAKDLLKGCELVSTGALVLCNDDMGCAVSTRHYAKQAARSVVATTAALLQVFCRRHHDDNDNNKDTAEHVAAQKTGAVWSACDAVAKLPKGNRTSMRRDLLLWTRECTETMEEFAQLIAKGPSLAEEEEEKSSSNSWEDFCGGDAEQYTAKEIPVAEACVALVKCSRGTMNVAMQACECAGEASARAECASSATTKEGLLQWIATLHDMARRVAEGMTDLGTQLYPPLDLTEEHRTGENLSKQATAQRDFIVALHEFVLDASFDMNEDIVEMATKLRAAANTRYDEAKRAMSRALQEQEQGEIEEQDRAENSASS